MIYNKKIIIFVALVLMCLMSVSARPKFSISWENSFLTGAISFNKDVLPWDIIHSVTKGTKGGQSLLVIGCDINNIVSVGIGSGANVSKLDFEYYYYWDYVESESLPMFYIPFFGEARVRFPVVPNMLSIYGGTKIGFSISPPAVPFEFDGEDYECSFDKGFFLEPSVGIVVSVRKFRLDLGIAYHLQKSGLVIDGNTFDGYEYEEIAKEYAGTYPFNLHQFVVKLGLGINI